MCLQFLGAADIALAIGRVLQELSIFIEIAMRRLNAPMSFDDEEACLGTVVGDGEAESGAARNHDVVTLVIGQQTKVGLQCAVPVMDKVHFIALRVAVEVAHRCSRQGYGLFNIFIVHTTMAVQYGISS